jgi:hypothetical protein
MKKLLIITLAVLVSITVSAQPMTREDIESAFLFHFINYTEWNDDLQDYYVCIPQDNALREAAAVSLKGKVINNRKVVVVDRSDSCHILVSQDVPRNDHTLTVGPLSKGALLEFRFVNNKVKFAANLKRIKESKLKISSQLLKLAILENGL